MSFTATVGDGPVLPTGTNPSPAEIPASVLKGPTLLLGRTFSVIHFPDRGYVTQDRERDRGPDLWPRPVVLSVTNGQQAGPHSLTGKVARGRSCRRSRVIQAGREGAGQDREAEVGQSETGPQAEVSQSVCHSPDWHCPVQHTGTVTYRPVSFPGLQRRRPTLPSPPRRHSR